MFRRSATRACVSSSVAVAMLAATMLVSLVSVALSGGDTFFGDDDVGGVLINAEGVLENTAPDVRNQLRSHREKLLKQLPDAAREASPMRMVSLRRLEEAIAAQLKNFQPLTDEMKYLGGLQRVEYVFVVPEQKDIILAGPGEALRIDARGTVVGETSGLPVLQLDDLLVALRSADAARNGGISCSIDPTPEGLARYQRFMKTQTVITQQTVAGVEEALGAQMITVKGVPETSRFATVMVSADYRMKRIAMGLDPSPVKGLPNFLEMMPANSRKVEMPRWWMAPHYEPMLKDDEGLSWQIRGQGVMCMTEEEVLTASGEKQKTGRTGTPAHRWAEMMTAKFSELAAKEPVFAELRNCIDLAIVGALIAQEDLTTRAGLPMKLLLDDGRLMIDSYNPPKQVSSQASVLKKGRNWLISTSGGVQFQPWELIQGPQQSTDLEIVRSKVEAAQAKHWWWN